MNLLEWLSGNITFVIIIAFAFFSFLGKVKNVGGSGGSQRQSREFRRPDGPLDSPLSREEEYPAPYAPDTTYQDHRRDERGSVNRNDERSYAEDNASYEDVFQLERMDQDIQLEIERERLTKLKDESERAARLAALIRTEQTSPSNDDDQKEGLFANPSDVRKGMIMAEVLGPPRAKRPFYSRNKY